MSIRRLYHRLFRTRHRSRLAVLRLLPTQAVCAEIGVWRGDFSRLILKHTLPHHLYLVDCWQYQPEFDPVGQEDPGTRQVFFESMYTQVQAELGTRPNVTVLRAFSSEIGAQIPAETLDWVYLDANHFYEPVKNDLEIYFHKVKPGGFIVGDDYDWGGGAGYPVRTAVTEFVAAGQVRLETVIRSQYVLRKLHES